MNILILAYASEPDAGSEYGVGWNVPLFMARQYPGDNVYVLTRSRCREKIEDRLRVLGLGNLRYLFYDIPSWLYYSKEMGSRWGEQYNYLMWQLLARGFLKSQHKVLHFDIVHHLTFNQYRTPSPGFFLGIPFVMGPVGGAETIAPAFFQDLDEATRRKEGIRQKGRDLRLFGWLANRTKGKKAFLFSSKENKSRLAPHCGNGTTMVMPAIGFTPEDFSIGNEALKKEGDTTFTMLYAGKALDWKGIRIFLRAAARGLLQAGKTDFLIKLVGIRSEQEQRMVMSWVDELGLSANVKLIPFIQRKELLRMLQGVSLSVYPAFRDSGSMSVLEASALGCPTICFDAGGQDAFPDDTMLKVSVADTYEACLNAFAAKLLWAHEHRDEIASIGQKARDFVHGNLTWERKVRQFYDIYTTCCCSK